jgi:hypothetical protein
MTTQLQLLCLRVNLRDEVIYYDNFATVAQAENFRRQFRKIISKDLVRILCGKAMGSNGVNFPHPFDTSTPTNGRIEVYPSKGMFEITLRLIETGLAIYNMGKKLHIYDMNTNVISEPSFEPMPANTCFPVGVNKSFGQFNFTDAIPYQVGISGNEFAPPVSLIQIDAKNLTVFCNSVGLETNVYTILSRIVQFCPNVSYNLHKGDQHQTISLTFTLEEFFLGTILFFYCLDMAKTGVRMLISNDISPYPTKSFELEQLV